MSMCHGGRPCITERVVWVWNIVVLNASEVCVCVTREGKEYLGSGESGLVGGGKVVWSPETHGANK